MRASLAAIAFVALPFCDMQAQDAVTVNTDGTVTFSNTAAGLNLLDTASTVPVGSSNPTLTTSHWGKLCIISGTACTISLPPAGPATGYGAGAVIALAVAPPTVGAPASAWATQFLITPQSGQSLDGKTTGLVLLPTNYIELMSVGGNWISRVKKLETEWINSGPLGISAASGTQPTKGATTHDVVWWRRSGDSVMVRVEYDNGAGGTAGTGPYLFATPNAFPIDSSKIQFVTATSNPQGGRGLCGYGNSCDGSTACKGFVIPYDATHLRVYAIRNDGTTTNNNWWGNTDTLSYASRPYYMNYTVPITNW